MEGGSRWVKIHLSVCWYSASCRAHAMVERWIELGRWSDKLSDLQGWRLFQQRRLFPVGALRFTVLISFSWHLQLLIKKKIEFMLNSVTSCLTCSLENIRSGLKRKFRMPRLSKLFHAPQESVAALGWKPATPESGVICFWPQRLWCIKMSVPGVYRLVEETDMQANDNSEWDMGARKPQKMGL